MKTPTLRRITLVALGLVLAGVAAYEIYFRYFFHPDWDLSPMIEESMQVIESFTHLLERTSVMVIYDDDGNLWLAGPNRSGEIYTTTEELSPVLESIEPKGFAMILHFPKGGTSHSYDPEIESQIRDALTAAGFSLTLENTAAAEQAGADQDADIDETTAK